jgi:hypothetical protein
VGHTEVYPKVDLMKRTIQQCECSRRRQIALRKGVKTEKGGERVVLWKKAPLIA